MIKKIKDFLYKPRKGKMFEFASYLMYNPRAMQNIINFIKIVQPIVYGFFSILFWYVKIYFVFAIFMIMFLASIYSLFKHIKYRGYASNTMAVSKIKNHLFNNKIEYVESKIVKKISKKHGR